MFGTLIYDEIVKIIDMRCYLVVNEAVKML